jgi:hypothetical protein
LENDPDLFWNQYEQGRRSVFEKEDHLASAHDLIDLYESEAQKSAKAKAYYAAITMLGSAAEARILLECLRQRTKIGTIVRKLPAKTRPTVLDPLKWNLADLINVAKEAGSTAKNGWTPSLPILRCVTRLNPHGKLSVKSPTWEQLGDVERARGSIFQG